MHRLLLVILVAFVSVAGSACGQARAQTVPLAQTSGACGGCVAACRVHVDNCAHKRGAASCALASACLCQCRLNAGGCGAAPTALQRCVQTNAAMASVQLLGAMSACSAEQTACTDAAGQVTCRPLGSACPTLR